MIQRLCRHTRRQEEGFTLIELLVVIIILGILAAVVVFAVGGVGDKGQASAVRTDYKTLQTALEANCARNGGYATEDGLITAGLLSERSTTHDILLNSSGICGTDGVMGTGYVIQCVATAAICESKGITVGDSADFAVTVPKPAQRVVCIVGACEDVLAALGATSRMVIRSVDTTNNPSAIAAYGTAGVPTVNSAFLGAADEDVAQIAAADPDLVIGLGPFQGYLRSAMEPIAPFFDMDIGSYQMSISNLYKVGQLLGLNAEAEAAANLLRDRISQYAALSPRTRVPVNIYSFFLCCGFDLLADSVGESQGGSLWATQGSYPWPSYPAQRYISGGQITFDVAKIKQVDPDAIFVIRNPASSATVNDPGGIRATNPAVWDSLKAVINGRVYEGANVKSWPWATGGTIAAAKALDQAMDTLYPEVAAFPLP